MSAALAAINAVFPGSTLTKSTLKRTKPMTETPPENAEHEAMLEALRQAYTLIAAQRRFINPAAEPALDAALAGIASCATIAKENP
jgi:hypothetical protein